MRKREIITLQPEKKDLKNIFAYIFEETESKEIAKGVLLDLQKKIDEILFFPRIGRERSFNGKDYYQITLGKYCIFYQTTETEIEIYRIIHSSRDTPNVF